MNQVSVRHCTACFVYSDPYIQLGLQIVAEGITEQGFLKISKYLQLQNAQLTSCVVFMWGKLNK